MNWNAVSFFLAVGLAAIAFTVLFLAGVESDERPEAALSRRVDRERDLISASSADAIPAMEAETTIATAEIDTADLDTMETEIEEPAAGPENPEDRPIRLQVLNGCGVRGIARNVAPALRRMGFDVRESGNAKNFRHEASRAYDRMGNLSNAYEVANAVGIDSSLVGELPDPDLVDIDVTIVVGADYADLNLGVQAETEE